VRRGAGPPYRPEPALFPARAVTPRIPSGRGPGSTGGEATGGSTTGDATGAGKTGEDRDGVGATDEGRTGGGGGVVSSWSAPPLWGVGGDAIDAGLASDGPPGRRRRKKKTTTPVRTTMDRTTDSFKRHTLSAVRHWF
jgi:hypothetical protein